MQAIEEMTSGNSRLVLNIGDEDPDDSYSSIAYEKGFTLLWYLERLVGSIDFETIFMANVSRFSSRILTSDEFKEFFMFDFEDKKEVIAQIG